MPGSTAAAAAAAAAASSLMSDSWMNGAMGVAGAGAGRGGHAAMRGMFGMSSLMGQSTGSMTSSIGPSTPAAAMAGGGGRGGHSLMGSPSPSRAGTMAHGGGGHAAGAAGGGGGGGHSLAALNDPMSPLHPGIRQRTMSGLSPFPFSSLLGENSRSPMAPLHPGSRVARSIPMVLPGVGGGNSLATSPARPVGMSSFGFHSPGMGGLSGMGGMGGNINFDPTYTDFFG